MSRITWFLVALVVLVVGACGSQSTENADRAAEKTPTSTATAPTTEASPEPAFDLAGWTEEWGATKQTYLYALQGFNNQLELLSKGGTEQQYALVVSSNAGRIADAAAAFARALEGASAIPADRADVQQAVAGLRTALLDEEKAYRIAAKCRRDYQCIKASEAAVVKAAQAAGAAMKAMPAE